MRLRVGQIREGLGDPVESDGAGVQWRGVDLPAGDQLQRARELGRVAAWIGVGEVMPW